MKAKFSKRILSFFLAVMMVVTSIPMFALTASAATGDHFLLAYFTGDGNVANSGGVKDQAIRFAVSTNGQNYEPVNGGKQVIQQYVGTRNARDPYIFKGQDGMYYCLATDANCNNNNFWGNSQTMVFWRSSDLVNWKDATVINMAQITGKTVYRCWAPQVIWDGSQYMVYFALAADGYANNAKGDNTHMYYCTTTDLLNQSKYSKPQPLVINSSKDNIDGDITYFNGNYYLFYKDETNSTICVIKSDKINEFNANNRVVLKTASSVGAIEGCQVFQNNKGEFIFMADRFNSNGNFVVYNLGTNLDVVISGASSGTYTLPSQVSHNLTTSGVGPRHGSVIKITADQYNALKTATFTTEEPADASTSTPALPTDRNNGIDLSSDLIAQYFVNSNVSADATNKYALSTAGSGASWNSASFGGHGAAYFTADNYMYTNSVSSMLSNVSGSDGVTFSFYGLPEGNDTFGRYFEINSNGTKGSITWEGTGNYVSVKATKDGSNLEVEAVNNNNFAWDSGRWGGMFAYDSAKWTQFTVTITNTHICLYINGEQKVDLTHNTAITSTLFDGFKNSGYLLLGASGYNDTTYTGYMRDFRVYSRAITSDEAAKLYNQYAYDNSYSIAEIKQVMTNYETKMNDALKNKTLLTNMKPAYDAYVALRKGFDAYYYGGDNTVDILGLTVALITKTAAMKTWSAYTANNPRPTFDKGTVPDGTFSNLLYSRKANGKEAFSVDISGSDVKFQVGYNETVLLYSDNNVIPSMPVMFVVRKNGTGQTRSRYVYSVYPTTSSAATDTHTELILNDMWYSSGSANWNFQNEYGKTAHRVGHNYDTRNAGKEMRTAWGASDYVAYANVLKFNTNSSWGSEYYKSYKNLNWNAYVGGGNLSTNLHGTGSVNDNSTIYVVNYKMLLDKLNTTKGLLPTSMNNYKQGGLSSLLGAIDKATSYNPNYSFTSASTAANGISDFNSRMSDIIPSLTNASLGSADTSESGYVNLRAAMDKYLNDPTGYLDKNTYTEESIAEYTKVYENAAQSIFKDVDNNGYAHNTYAQNAADALGNILNKKLNLSGLYSKIQNNDIYDDNGVQCYTFDSWLAAFGNAANTYKKLSSETGEFKTISSTYDAYDGTTVTYLAKTTTSNQAAADNANVDSSQLVAVDQVGYPSFDAAYTVANAVDEDKYVADKFAEFESAVATAYANVYTTTTTENADLYNLFTSSNKISSTTPLRTSLTQTNTDNNTSAILTAIDTLNQNIRTLKVNISENVENPSVSSTEYHYGSTFTVALPSDVSVAQGKVVQWVITKYASTEDMENDSNPISSQVIAKNPDDTIELVANGAFDIQYIVEGGATTAANVYKVYNAYGKVAEIIYSDTALSDAELNTAIKFHPVLPFYTFASWTVGEADENGIVPVTPVFTIDGAYKTISVIGTGVDYSAKDMNESKTAALVGTDATLSKSGVYGWAVKKDGKYQIVGYGDSYTFTVIENEVYTAITTDGSSYFVEDGAVALTKDNVYGFTTPVDSSVVDANAYLNAKLTDKAPFVYYQLTQAVLEQSKQRVYVRITGGSNATSFGLIFTDGVNENRFNSTATNAGGQFYVQMKNTTYEAKSIKAFVNYSFTYQGKKVNTIDYASVK